MPYLPITSVHDPRLAVFSGMTDAELRDPKQLVGLARAIDASGNGDRPSYPNNPNRLADGLFVAESRNVIDRAIGAGYTPFALLIEEHWLDQTKSLADKLLDENPVLPVFVGSREAVSEITGYELIRGAFAAFHRRALPDMESLLQTAHRIAILEDVTNYTNIGAIFRSAAALGIDAVLLTPRCHDPLYRRAARVSMGTVFQVPWTRIPSWPREGIDRLHNAGFTVAALALSDDSLPLQTKSLQSIERLALVLGTEGDGLAQATIAACDATVRIPMKHGVDSLNVAAASAVAFWELRTTDRE